MNDLIINQINVFYERIIVLEKLAYEDDLTHIGNRRKFEKDYEEVQKGGKPYAVLYIDLNGLKQINDTQGHDAGSTLIKLLASNLRKNIDKCYRLGGDEFVAIVDNISASNTVKVVNRLDEVFQQSGCSAAIGWAHSMFSTSPLQDADACMYKFKKISKSITYL